MARSILKARRVGGFSPLAVMGRDLFFYEPNTGANGTAPATGNPAPAPAAAPAPVQQAAPVPNGNAELLTAVQQHLTAAIAPVMAAQTALSARVDQLAAPRSQSGANPGQLFGGAPAVRTGEDPLSSRGYQLQRVLGLRQGYLRADACKVELDIHEKLYQAFVQVGGMVCEGHQSILVPLSSAMIPDEFQALRTEIAQSVRQGVAGGDFRLAMAIGQASGGRMTVAQAMSLYDDSALGVFAGPTQQGEMIDLIRAREVWSRVGASQITLPPNGRMSWPSQTSAGSAYWVGEGATLTPSQPGTGIGLQLIAKKLGMLYKLPNELLRFTTPETEMFLRNDMARVIGLKSDEAMFDGTGGTQIKGLLNYTGFNSVTASTTGANGNTFTPEDPARMMSALEDAQWDPETNKFGWMMRPKMWWDMANKRADAITAADAKGPWLFPVDRGSLDGVPRSSLLGSTVYRSTQVPNDRQKGDASNLSCIIAGAFSEWLIARVGVMEIALSTQGDTPFTTDSTWIRAIQHLDAGPRYLSAFAVCDDLVLPS